MIELRGLRKTFRTNGITKIVARNINFTFPSNTSIALLGRNGAGKSTLLQMIAGTAHPTEGEILSDGTISWPVGFAGSFHPDLTGAQNARFVARIYGIDTDELADFVQDFAELGQHYFLPVRTYSSGMRSRLAFGISMAIDFDTYLIDEVTSVGDQAFRMKSQSILMDRLSRSGAIIVSHSMALLQQMCTAGAVLEDGRLYYYARVQKAIEHHQFIMRGTLPPWLQVMGPNHAAHVAQVKRERAQREAAAKAAQAAAQKPAPQPPAKA